MGKKQNNSEENLEEEGDSPKPQKVNEPPSDDPMKRHEGLKLDLECMGEERKFADLRRAALEQAQKMSASEEK